MRLAFDRNLPPSEALGRIRDHFRSYDERAASVGYDEASKLRNSG
jgi:hypothetical protein